MLDGRILRVNRVKDFDYFELRFLNGDFIYNFESEFPQYDGIYFDYDHLMLELALSGADKASPLYKFVASLGNNTLLELGKEMEIDGQVA